MKYKILFFLLSLSLISIGQTDNEKKAYDIAMEAIKLMDNGQYDESIDLLKQSKKLDPTNYNYSYEIGYAFLLKKDYKNAAKTFEKTVKYEKLSAQCFQMLGNTYDMGGNPDKAIKAYNRGLEKFPNSGKLYLELGNMQKDLNTALQFYEKGIALDPMYPSNYYQATKIFLENTELEVWGMIYGELFLNIERGSKRTEEISKILFDTYKSEMKFTTDGMVSVSFCNNASIQISSNEDADLKLPFGLLVYEPTILISTIGIDSINLETLNEIRTKFLSIYFEKEFNENHPNVLFDWQKEIDSKGFFESYNYWILMKGNEVEFGNWIKNNEAKFNEFIDWFSPNQIKIDNENKFIRME